MTNRQIGTLAKFYNSKTEFPEPKVIGYFSIDENQTLVQDISQLKYMLRKPGSTHLDLTFGENAAKQKQLLTKKVPFFQYLSQHEEIIGKFESSNLKNVGFVMGRSTLLLISQFPYVNNKSDAVLVARLVNGAIYLYDASRYDKNAHSQPGTWGYKFQQYMLSRSANDERDTDEAVNEDEEFVGVYELTLQSHHILYRAEIHGILANEIHLQEEIPKNLDEQSIVDQLNSKSFVQIKSSFKTEEDRNFRIHKTRTLWAQNYYGACKHIFMGHRNEEGVVTEIKEFDIKDLENLGEGFWKSNVMLNFTEKFLTYVKKCFMDKMQGTDDVKKIRNVTLFFKKIPRGPMVQCDEPENMSNDWLPEWYIENRCGNLNN